jgi:hypothetical protein
MLKLKLCQTLPKTVFSSLPARSSLSGSLAPGYHKDILAPVPKTPSKPVPPASDSPNLQSPNSSQRNPPQKYILLPPKCFLPPQKNDPPSRKTPPVISLLHRLSSPSLISLSFYSMSYPLIYYLILLFNVSYPLPSVYVSL